MTNHSQRQPVTSAASFKAGTSSGWMAMASALRGWGWEIGVETWTDMAGRHGEGTDGKANAWLRRQQR